MAPSSSNGAGTVTASTLVGPSTNKLATMKKPSKRPTAVSSAMDANGVPGSQNRKRKFTVEERREHSVIEKKRRENLNEKLLILARNLPTLNDKEHKRLSKNIIVTHAISHVQTVQALFRAALPQLRDLLEEHDQMHMELDRMRINAGLKPHPRDREDEHHIRELFQVDGWKYASFPNGFQGEKGDGHEEEDEAASAQKQELPTLKPIEEVEAAVPQPTPQISNSSLTIPANDNPLERQAHAHAQAPLPVYDDSAFLMNNFQFLDQHRRPYQPEEEPLHRPAVDQPRQPTHARQPYYDEMFSLSGHARGVDGSLTYNAGGPADSTAGGQTTFDQTGTEDLRLPQLPQDLTAFMSSFNDSGYPQFPTSTSNLDFLLHWPTGAAAVDHGSIAATTSTPSLSEPGASHTPASTSASSPHVPYGHPSRLHAPVPTYLHRQHDGYDYPPHRGG